jgi:hypothetical protein
MSRFLLRGKVAVKEYPLRSSLLKDGILTLSIMSGILFHITRIRLRKKRAKTDIVIGEVYMSVKPMESRKEVSSGLWAFH